MVYISEHEVISGIHHEVVENLEQQDDVAATVRRKVFQITKTIS